MSRFVSGGTNEEPNERDEAWLKAQQELDARHVAKQTASRQGEGKSLFETLEANKGGLLPPSVEAAKQDAFEEANRLKNQFRSLDEDEIEFLDSVLEDSRKKEAEVRKETTEQLDLFRKQQEEAEKASKLEDGAEPAVAAAESWGVGPRKRKKGKERDGIGGVKLRRTSTATKDESQEMTPVQKETAQPPDVEKAKAGNGTLSTTAAVQSPNPSAPPAPPAAKPGLGLGVYSSDEDD